MFRQCNKTQSDEDNYVNRVIDRDHLFILRLLPLPSQYTKPPQSDTPSLHCTHDKITWLALSVTILPYINS